MPDIKNRLKKINHLHLVVAGVVLPKAELLNSNGLVTAEDVFGVKENYTKTTENQAKPEDKKPEKNRHHRS